MDVKPIIAIALIISAVLLAAKLSPEMSTEQFKEGKYIHVDNMVIEFNKANATVNIEYHLSAFAEAYIFLFGSKHLEPKIMEIFADFKEVKIQKIESDRATLQITNISRKSGIYYLQDSREFGVRPDVLTLVYPYPESGTRTIRNPESTSDNYYLIDPKDLSS